MPDGNDKLSITAHGALAELGEAEWDACAGTANPFIRHAFLKALEESGSACLETGWAPRHLAIRSTDGLLLACAPLYLKSHSYGEYVFDWAWAQAYERAGGRYYPKLQCAVPFTPVTGPRLLVHPGQLHQRDRLEHMLGAAMVELANRSGASSVHITFPTDEEVEGLERRGFLRRTGCQYHWENDGYGCFEDFLAALSSRKRKAIRKERDAVSRQGVALSTLVGSDIKARHWDVFHDFYQRVTDRKWGQAYITRGFFEALSATPLGEKAVLVWAERDGEPLGCAFNMMGEDTLYGRTWGAAAQVDFLHFEACYYRAMDFAITHGLKRVEAGAQGEHKVARGYLPSATHSAHWIADAALSKGVARFLEAERPHMTATMAALAGESPFRQS